MCYSKSVPVWARPSTCFHNTVLTYDSHADIPLYECGCEAIALDFPEYVSLESSSTIDSFTMPLNSDLTGNANLGATIPMGGWVPDAEVMVNVHFAICYYDDNDVVNRVRDLDGYYVYCGSCYTDNLNEEGDFTPETTEDGFTAITLPEAVSHFCLSYEDEVSSDGVLHLQVDHRPGHILAEDEGIDAGLELASSIVTMHDTTFAREIFCAHCYHSIMRVEYL